jgi:dihydroorotate dehydrogenase (fumarate)
MSLKISPPLINSSNPWATTLEDLRNLYACEHTGAVTVRTSTLDGFAHDDAVHQYTFFEPQSFGCIHNRPGECRKASASLNTLGYSPISLPQTLENIYTISGEVNEQGSGKRTDKPFIVSVTGTPEELRACYHLIMDAQGRVSMPLYMEVNLSCPNISGKPPPAYNYDTLREYISALQAVALESPHKIPTGIKTPPYTNPENFTIVKKALLACVSDSTSSALPITFITATNTLGSCLLVVDDLVSPALGSADMTGIGGLAGSPLHPLALGNVRLLRRMLDSEPGLKGIKLIGIGGVSDAAGFQRMKNVGAEIVGVGTALGNKGIGVFDEITRGLEAIEVQN